MFCVACLCGRERTRGWEGRQPVGVGGYQPKDQERAHSLLSTLISVYWPSWIARLIDVYNTIPVLKITTTKIKPDSVSRNLLVPCLGFHNRTGCGGRVERTSLTVPVGAPWCPSCSTWVAVQGARPVLSYDVCHPAGQGSFRPPLSPRHENHQCPAHRRQEQP